MSLKSHIWDILQMSSCFFHFFLFIDVFCGYIYSHPSLSFRYKILNDPEDTKYGSKLTIHSSNYART